MNYILIAHGERGDLARVTICETADDRAEATLAAIYGKPEDADPEAAAKDLAQLRENKILRFEGDPPLEWVDAAEIEFRVPLFPTCEAVGHCPKPTHEAAPFHHFYWDADRDGERMNKIHDEGAGHDDPLSKYGAVMCKTCGRKALVLTDAEDFPEI